MAELEFAEQKYIVILSPRTYGDLDYKQRKNWNSPNHLQRERANLLFSRTYQGLYNLANDISPIAVVPTGVGHHYVYQLSDGIGRIIFKMIKTTTISIIYVIDFLWDYKTVAGSWWSIVEDKKTISRIVRETINQYLKGKYDINMRYWRLLPTSI